MKKQGNIQQELQRVSVELFATQGYAKTSVQQIVDAAGVTKGALYHYFSSKDDLLFDIYDRLLSLQREHLEEIVARGLPALETMRLVCEDLILTSIDSIREGAVFFRSQHMLSDSRQREVRRRRREFNDIFVALLEKGQQEGVFRTDIPQMVLAANFFAVPHYLSQWYSESVVDRAAYAAATADLYLTSIKNPETP